MNTSEKKRQPKTYLPTEIAPEQFAEFMQHIERFLDKKATLVSADKQEVIELPETLFDVLRQVAEALSSGRGVTVAPQESKLTTQAAADFLGMSRPTLIKLLESGKIAFELVGRHRRVTLRDVVDYRDRSRVERRAMLRRMAREGQAAGTLDLSADDMPGRA